MRESKEIRFRRVVEARVNKIIKIIRLLGNCSNRAIYAFTAKQVEQIFDTLQLELKQAQRRYAQSGNKRFSLSDTVSPEDPTIVLKLPDGTSLRAAAIDDDNFPAINIYWDGLEGKTQETICFAEYNSERSHCHELCIGVYQSDKDDVTYYEPYVAEKE